MFRGFTLLPNRMTARVELWMYWRGLSVECVQLQILAMYCKYYRQIDRQNYKYVMLCCVYVCETTKQATVQLGLQLTLPIQAVIPGMEQETDAFGRDKAVSQNWGCPNIQKHTCIYIYIYIHVYIYIYMCKKMDYNIPEL